jgi:hypothetical protein
MSTLVVHERVEHIHADPWHNRVTVDKVNYVATEATEHDALVEAATSELAAHYTRFMARGGDAARPSGLCVSHRVLAFIIVHFETNMVLAAKELGKPWSLS